MEEINVIPKPILRKAVPLEPPLIVAQPPTPRHADEPFQQFVPLPDESRFSVGSGEQFMPPRRSRLTIRSIGNFRLPSLTL